MDDADLEAILAEYEGADDASSDVPDVPLSPMLSSPKLTPVKVVAPTVPPLPSPPAPALVPKVDVPAANPPAVDPRMQQLAATMERRREDAILAPVLNAAPPRTASVVAPPVTHMAAAHSALFPSHDDFQPPSKGHRTMTGRKERRNVVREHQCYPTHTPLPLPTDAELGLDAILAEYGGDANESALFSAGAAPSAGGVADVSGRLDEDSTEEDSLLADLVASARMLSAGRASIAAAAAAPVPPGPARGGAAHLQAGSDPAASVIRGSGNPSTSAPRHAAPPQPPPPASSSAAAPPLDAALALTRASVCALATAAAAEADLVAGDSGGPSAALLPVSPLARYRRRARGGGLQRGVSWSERESVGNPGSARGPARRTMLASGQRGSFSTADDDDAETGSVASSEGAMAGAAAAEDGGGPRGMGHSRRSLLRLSCGRDLLAQQHQQQQQRTRHSDAAAAEAPKGTVTGVLGVARLGRLSEQLGGFVRQAQAAQAAGAGIPTVVAVHPRFIAVGTARGVVVLFDPVSST